MSIRNTVVHVHACCRNGTQISTSCCLFYLSKTSFVDSNLNLLVFVICSSFQKKGKRKGLSKALQDFSAFQKSLDNSLLAGVGKKSGLKAKTSSSKCKILKSESERLSAVVSHPQYQLNPLEAIQNHLNQTLPTEKTTPGRPSRTTKTLTEREKKQMRYRKKMEKEANRMMDM